MSNFNFEDCYLTYFITCANSLFEDELKEAIARAIAPVDTKCKIATTSMVTEIRHGTGQYDATLRFRGLYCILVFENDEDRAFFKLSVPNNQVFNSMIAEVLQ